MNPLPFDRTQKLYVLKPGVDPQVAIHPERFPEVRRKHHQSTHHNPEIRDAKFWAELPRLELVNRLFEERRLHRVVLTTDAGLGKTYNLAWLCWELNDRTRRRRAFVLSIGQLNTVGEVLDTIVEIVCKVPKNDSVNATRVRADLITLRQRGQVVLLLDGLDMAGDAKVQVLKELLDPKGDWCHCAVVVAGRRFAVARHRSELFDDKPWHYAQIGEFTKEQQRRALGKLPDGRDRFDCIPIDARGILGVPRVLEYLRPLGQEQLRELRTVSDVYWRATCYMLKSALGKDVSVLTWNRMLALLGALAFTMFERTERDAKLQQFCPNLDRVRALDVLDFLQTVLARMISVLSCDNVDYNEKKFTKDLRKLSSLNTVMNHGWLDVDDVGDVRADFVWRNASLQEFFAAYWVTRWGVKSDTDALSKWVVDPLTGANQGFYWFWRYASEMPDNAVLTRSKVPPAAWQAAMSPLYTGDDSKRVAGKPEKKGLLQKLWAKVSYGDPCPLDSELNALPIRSTEFIYRSWDRMAGTQARETYLNRFQEIRKGAYGDEKKQIADRMLDGFISLVAKQEARNGELEWLDTGLPDDIFTIKNGHPVAIFQMGASADEEPEWDTQMPGGKQNNPQHRVTLSPYRLNRFCVTNLEYELFDPRHQEKRWFAGRHPYFKPFDNTADDPCPVVNVSWYDAWCFARWLGAVTSKGITKEGEVKETRCRIDLPTEAQWEYGCRAGRTTPFSFDKAHDGRTCAADVCNFDGDFPFGDGAKQGQRREHTVPVDGQRNCLKPNRWGFFQMHGNVWEWCQDWYDEGFYDSQKGKEPNPVNSMAAIVRVFRGGGWSSPGKYCRSALRDGYEPEYLNDDIGFRLAAVPVLEPSKEL